MYGPHVLPPQTEKELDKFLLSVWGNEVSGPSFDMDPQTALEIGEMKDFFDRKLCELKQNYKVHLSELAHLADTSCTAHPDRELVSAVSEAKSQIKCFDRLRFELKEQMAATILELAPESLILSKRLSPRAASSMNRWYLQHSHYPYPTAKQKQDLARKCAVSVEQVSNWFSRQRACTTRKRTRKRRVPSRARRTTAGRRRRRRARRGKGRKRGRSKVVVRVRRRIVIPPCF